MYAASQYALEVKCGIKMDKYTEKVKKVDWLTARMLEKDAQGREILSILDAHFSGYKDQFLSEAQMIPVLKETCDDQDLNEAFKDLDNFKKIIRNPVSHTIVAVTPELIGKYVSYDIEYYLRKVKTILNILG